MPVDSYTRDSTFHHINQGLCVVKSTSINDFLREPFNLTVLSGLIFNKACICMEVRHPVLYYFLLYCSLVALKCMRLPTNYIALPVTFSNYPYDHCEFQPKHVYPIVVAQS